MSLRNRRDLLRRRTAASRRHWILVIGLLLSACGGGGGSNAPSGPAFTSLSTSSLSFAAANPFAPVPASQVVSATATGVVSGTLYIKIEIDGLVIATATNVQIISATQGQVTFNPGMPANLGIGTHTSTITISLCTTDPACSGDQLAGSPKTISVSYRIGSTVQSDAIAPYVGTSNIAGEVILRGQGFLPATTVAFGGIPGTIVGPIPGDTEIHARYPALAAGSYAVTLNNGNIAFTALLTIVDPPAYASDTLAYPVPPQQMRGLVYDAERSALLVGAGFANSSDNLILRFASSNGIWSTVPQTITIPDLRDIALSVDGSRLLAIDDDSMSQIDPVTFSSIATTSKPTSTSSAGEYLKGLAVANDGNVMVTTGYKSGTGSTLQYFYSPVQSAFSTPGFAGGNPVKLLFYPAVGASGNGATIALLESLIPAQPVVRYTASSGIQSSTNQLVQHYNPDLSQNINAPSFDRTGSRMAVAAFAGTIIFPVYDANATLLGLLPSNTLAYIVSPDGTRAYTLELDTGICQVRAFDLVTTPGGSSPLTALVAGYPITPVLCPGSGFPPDVRMSVSPAGDTLFMAGNDRIVIVQLP